MTDAKNIVPRDEKFLAFVRTKPCEVCGIVPSVAAHGPGRKGTGMRTSDFTALPLCGHHHGEQHQRGVLTFAEKYEINYYECSFRLLHEFHTGVLP